MFGGNRIQVAGVDLAIRPAQQAETLFFRFFHRTVTDAIDGMAGVRQFARQIAANKPVWRR